MKTLSQRSLYVFFLLFSFAAFAQDAVIPPESVEASDEDTAMAAAARIGGSVNVAIELTDEPSAVIYARVIAQNTPPNRPVDPATRGNANSAAKKHLGVIKKAQEAVLAALQEPSIDAKIFFTTQRTFNGFGATVAADRIDRIRDIPGVKSVHLIAPQTVDLAGSVPFINAPAAWVAGLGSNHGENIRVGVIDTGIDYLHTNFGGPGSGYGANNTTVIGDTPGYFPGTKVVGGWDFAGDNYDAGTAGHTVPVPDPDPMDCAGHGSHVAGIIGGSGVRSDGSTYPGPYDGTTPFSTLKIGPGVAPNVQLYALRVFGCSGSTALTTAAIDWAVDPNRDGDFSDHLDVINMSLGSPLGSPFDSSTIASENASLAGVIVVAAAGNNGDTHYIVSAPGTSARTITVAASQDNGFPAMRVNAPASIAGLKPIGKASGWGVPLTDPGVTAPVVATVPNDACNTITNVAAVAGKIAFIDRGGTAPGGAACGFELKAKNAQNAGAVGVIIGNVTSSAAPNQIPITMGSGGIGGVTIPAVEMGLDQANEIRANVGSGTVNATLLRSATTSLPAAGDLTASFSSRGIRRVDSLLKPDISAPGVSVDSTLALSGIESTELSGTSMATPHMAGTMALLRQLHPDWSVEELKALVMNTATHDLFLNVNQTPPRYATARIGAGRVDLATASSGNVVAMNTDGNGSVGVSFGFLQVLGSGTWTKTIQVVNKGAVTQTYAVSLAPLTNLPGVSYSLPDGASLTAPAGGTATLHVQLSATASAMRHTLDPTMTTQQASTSGALNNRQYLTEQTGYVVLTPGSGPTLRVPVHAVLRPASAMGTTQTAILMTAPAATTTINLSGTQINSGGATSTDERSLVTTLELNATSPDQGSTDPARRAVDIRNVGIASDAKQRGTVTGSGIFFGISTSGKWTTMADVEFDIYIDTDRNGTFDWVVFTTAFVNGANRLDIPVSVALNLATNAQVTQNFLNNASGATETGLYNSNVVVVPMLNNVIGLTNANSKFNYTIFSFARGVSGSVDSLSGTYDPLHPGLNFNVGFTGAPFFTDFNGVGLNVQYSQADLNPLKAALLIHHLNGDGARDQVLPATPPSATSTSVAAAAGQYSDGVTLSATVSPSTFAGQTVSGSVAFTVDGSSVGSAGVNASGVASLTYVITGAAGPHSIGTSFTSSNAFFLNSSGTGTLTVSRETANVVPSASNPAYVPTGAGGTAASIALAADISEVPDGSLGNIALAAPVTVTLNPTSGPAITQTAVISVSGSTAHAAATFTNVPPSVYGVSFVIGGSNYTGSATGGITVFDPAATIATVAAASGQYSDGVVLSATVTPATFLGQTISGSVQFSIDGNAIAAAAVNAAGVASVPYVITVPAGAHTIGASFTPASFFFKPSSGSGALNVSREDASVVPSSSNPVSVQVSAPGGTAASVSLAADITEIADGSAGDIALAAPMTVTLTPVGPGSAISQIATIAVSGATAHAVATFTNVPVNVYDVSYSIGGSFYAGGANGVLAVFDPSLGNVTGGGTIMHDGVMANFGFNLKYQKNGNAQGSILYIEHRPTGDVKVKSNALDTLSIAGNTAIALGKATVADVGNYAFRLTVVDNGEPGSVDQFGLRISKGSNEVPDLTFAPITLSGGNIQVPQPK